VLRVKKVLKDRSQPAPNCMVFSDHEQLLWGHTPELVESVKQDCLNQAYAVHVMSQHLGANHVDGGVRPRFSLCLSCYRVLFCYQSINEQSLALAIPFF
jgi:inositol-pentakisphosphate 2-kinase